MNGIELARRFFLEAGLPRLRRHFPDLAGRVAAGLVAGGFESGCGSEVGGFDDEISRDHTCKPRPVQTRQHGSAPRRQPP
jgi:hypothetical protein